MKQIAMIPNVTMIFSFLVSPFSFQNNSSTVSLAGNTQSGAAVKIAKKIAKFPYKNFYNKSLYLFTTIIGIFLC